MTSVIHPPEHSPTPQGTCITMIKVETVLAELNRLRNDLEKDPDDLEWFALHHAFCFISYKMGEFQQYLNETVKEGEYPES